MEEKKETKDAGIIVPEEEKKSAPLSKEQIKAKKEENDKLKKEQQEEDAKAEKDLFDEPVDGVFLAKTEVDVSMPEIVMGVVIRKDGRFFVLKKDNVKGLGLTIESAIKSFKKAWQEGKQNTNTPKKKKKDEKKKEEKNTDDDKSVYDKAVELCKKEKKITVAILQKKLKIGFSLASRVIEDLKTNKIIAVVEKKAKV